MFNISCLVMGCRVVDLVPTTKAPGHGTTEAAQLIADVFGADDEHNRSALLHAARLGYFAHLPGATLLHVFFFFGLLLLFLVTLPGFFSLTALHTPKPETPGGRKCPTHLLTQAPTRGEGVQISFLRILQGLLFSNTPIHSYKSH